MNKTQITHMNLDEILSFLISLKIEYEVNLSTEVADDALFIPASLVNIISNGMMRGYCTDRKRKKGMAFASVIPFPIKILIQPYAVAVHTSELRALVSRTPCQNLHIADFPKIEPQSQITRRQAVPLALPVL